MTFIFWLQFALVCIAGAMSPGPSLALIIRNSVTINRYAGILTSIGHGIGMSVYAVFAVTGLIIILTTNEILFQFIQIIGILFLLFIVIGAASSMSSIWAFSDAMIFAMIFPNMVGLFFLFPVVKKELSKYLDAIKKNNL